MKTTVFSIVVGALIAVMGIGLGVGWRGFGRADTHRLRVTGESRLVGEPDLAWVMFGVQKDGKTVAQAQERIAVVISKVIAAVQVAGVAKADVATSDLTIQQGWNYYKNVPSGYTVSSTLTITVRNVQHVGRVIDTAVVNGLNRLQGVSYDVQSPQWREKAMQEALANARTKAQAMAAGMGQPLGPVVTMQEIGMQQASPAEEFYLSRDEEPMVFSGEATRIALPRTRSLPGQRAMTVQVVVEYEL